MAITTRAGLRDGLLKPFPLFKAGLTNAAGMPTGQLRGLTTWYLGGNPPASTANAAGVNGQAVTPGLGASVAGLVYRENPSGALAYLAGVGARGSTLHGSGAWLLVDRLWQNSGLSATLTTLQSITPAAIPARDMNGAALGHGLMAATEWSAAGGVGTPTLTLTYTDQDGNTGVTTTAASSASPAAGVIEIFPLAAGDTGVRAITGYQASATRTSGTFHLIIFRIIAVIPAGSPVDQDLHDAVRLGMPRIYDDSVLQLIWIAGANQGNTNHALRVIEANG